MKARKIMALSLTAAMTLSMAACGDNGTQANSGNTAGAGTEVTSEQGGPTEATEQASDAGTADNDAADAGEVSIDFEDGVYGFVGVDKTVNSAGDDSALSVEDFAGSKALKVTAASSKARFLGIQVDALLGDSASSVKTVEMSIGTSRSDGTFAATSGNIYAFLGEDNAKNAQEWSVYLETANPKTVTYTVPDGQSFVAGNYMVVSLETDAGETPADFYIDNIVFKDASGNVLTADTSAEYAAADTGVDRSNLCSLKNAVEFEGFATSGDGWAQNGYDMPQEIIDALVPGSVVEISYSSENGDMWLVMPGAAAGWMRVGQGNADGSGSDSAVFDGSKCYITYEQIAAVCGDDVASWGTTMQCEASGAWEVYSVKVGKAAEFAMVKNPVEFEGFATSGDGWAQNGFDMPQEIIDALVPGSVVTINYTSETGDMWLVMPGATAGWMRVGQGNADGSGSDSAVFNGKTCQVTYEQIAAVCGDDVSAWGTTMQCEASGAWEVYSVSVGTAVE